MHAITSAVSDSFTHLPFVPSFWQLRMLATVLVQSTYCDNLRQHCETVGRSVHVVNLGESPSELSIAALKALARLNSGQQLTQQ